MADLPNLNMGEINRVKEISSGGHDRPVFMLNLNRYFEESGYPDGALYSDYMTMLHRTVDEVHGKVLWRVPVRGVVVGDQFIHEALGAWYPSHQAFLNLATAPSSDENMRLRALAVEHADLHRCDPY